MGGSFDAAKRLVRATVPLRWRIDISRRIAKLSTPSRHWWVFELLRDFADRDPNGFHRFLWSNHLAYAESYSIAARFGSDNIHPTRVLFFDGIREALSTIQVRPADVTGVFEAGCSLGYLLRHLEVGLFERAQEIEGNDIDGQAVADGQQYLTGIGSRVRLHQADLTALDAVFAGRTFDVVFAAGVLMYLTETDAERVVRTLLSHTGKLLALAALAHPDRDNRELEASGVRERDHTFIHNVDRMVERAGGRVVARRWEGSHRIDGNTVYFVFAQPVGAG